MKHVPTVRLDFSTSRTWKNAYRIIVFFGITRMEKKNKEKNNWIRLDAFVARNNVRVGLKRVFLNEPKTDQCSHVSTETKRPWSTTREPLLQQIRLFCRLSFFFVRLDDSTPTFSWVIYLLSLHHNFKTNRTKCSFYQLILVKLDSS